jgi:hypothetical protein
LKKGLSMMRSFVRRPDSCLSAPSSSSCFYIRVIRVPLCSFFFLPSSLYPSVAHYDGDHHSLLFLSLFLSFSSLQYRKEIKIVCVCPRHHCIVEEGGRHVVLYAFSHHSFFLYVDLFFLVLQGERKSTHIYIKKNIEH